MIAIGTQLLARCADEQRMRERERECVPGSERGARVRRASLEGEIREIGRSGRGDDLTENIIGACIEVHRLLGPGLLESAYEQCLCRELSLRGLRFERQRPLPIVYKGIRLDCGFRADLVVEDRVLVELKVVERLLPLHVAQLSTYLRLTDISIGLLVNFNNTSLRQGLRRLNRPSLPDLPISPIPPPKEAPRVTTEESDQR